MFDINYMFEEDNFSGVIILLDKTLNIIRVNDQFKKLQGYKDIDLYELPFVDIIVPDDKSKYFDATYTVENTKEFTIQCYHKHGAFRYFSFNMINLKDYKVLFGKAIKKEFKSYTYINESTNYLERAFSNLDVEDISEIIVKEDKNMSMFLSMFPIDIWIKDRYNRYVFVNDAYTYHTGHTLDDVYHRDDFQLFDREIAKGFTSSDNEAIAKGIKINYVFHSSINKILAWTEVTKIPLYNINNKYIGILGFSNDVSQSKLVEEKLNVIISKYKFALNKTNVLVAELDMEGTIIFAGGKLISVFGLDVEHLISKNIFSIHQDDAKIIAQMKRVYKGDIISVPTSMFNQKLMITMYPFYDKDKVISAILIASLLKENQDG